MIRPTAGLLFVFIGLSPMNAAESPAQAKVHLLFEKWDKNQDGMLDARELAKALRGPNAEPIPHADKEKRKAQPERHADQLFLDKYDKDKDGSISRSEFEAYEREVAAEQKKLQDQLRRVLRHRRHR